MILVPPRLKRALRNGSPLALLAAIDHPSEFVRVWSHTGTLDYDGHEWQGLGILGRVSGVTQSTSLAIKQVTLQMSGVPPTSTTFLSSRVRNRRAQVWLAALDGRKVIADPYLVIDALLDYQKIKVEDNGLATIQLTGNVGFWTIERAANRAWTHEEQQAAYPGDTGLSLLPTLVTKDVRWRVSD